MVTQIRNFRNRPGGGISVPKTNLKLVGIAMDNNGNKIAQFKSSRRRWERGFSVQTNQNLSHLHNTHFPADAHARQHTSADIRTYILKHGTKRQMEMVGWSPRQVQTILRYRKEKPDIQFRPSAANLMESPLL